MIRNSDALLMQVSRQVLDECQLLIDSEAADNHLKDTSNCDTTNTDQTAIIDVGENPHQEPIASTVSDD